MIDYAALPLIACVLLLARVAWKQRKVIASLREKRRAIVVEEHRMFSFLHGLGEALQTSITQEAFHQFILNGTINVVEASQGALYLTGKGGQRLVPAAMTPDCPPLLAELLPDHDPTHPEKQRSALRLRSIKTKDTSTLIANCLAERRRMHLADLSTHQAFANASDTDRKKLNFPAMVVPLYFGEKDLGVLVVIRQSIHRPFTKNDFAVFGSLADQCSLALGTEQLGRQAMAQQRLEEELLMAQEVQRILLPEKAPPLSGYRITARYQAAGSVSGDYYDFIPLGKHALGVAIADVSGKGLPASLTMVMGRSVLRANAEAWQSPAESLAVVNRILHPDMRHDMFVSMIYLIAKADSGEIILARAGHDPALIYRAATQTIEEATPPGLAVGVDAGRIFERDTKDFTLHLQPGDCLLLYTDGLTEAEDSTGDEFGIDRLISGFKDTAPHGAERIADALFKKVTTFAVDSKQTDDMTLVVLEKT